MLDKHLTMGESFENMASCPARMWDSRNLYVCLLSHRVRSFLREELGTVPGLHAMDKASFVLFIE